jgi:hypothetical protein
VRSVPLGGRFGLTVRFTVAGETSLRRDLAMFCGYPMDLTVQIMSFFHTVCQWKNWF